MATKQCCGNCACFNEATRKCSVKSQTVSPMTGTVCNYWVPKR